MNQTYQNYFAHHSYGIQLDPYNSERDAYMDKRFGEFINAGTRVLEIGSGLGSFARYCRSKNITKYTGVEIDTDVVDALQKEFPNYQFFGTDIESFFTQEGGIYDVIFCSHVFEHFNIEDGTILANHIAQHLSDHGVWINIMPNAANISGCLARYNDITHKTLYTSNSFNQVLQNAGYLIENIQHKNVWPKNILKKGIARILGKLIAVPYHTFEILSIISKPKHTTLST